MSIMTFIQEQKDGFRQRQNLKDAKELQSLRNRRLQEEGRSKIIMAKEKEKARIKKAESLNYDMKRILGFSGKVKGSKVIPKKEIKPRREFGEGINPAFGLGRDK